MECAGTTTAQAGLGYPIPSAGRVGVCSSTPEYFYYSYFLALNMSALEAGPVFPRWPVREQLCQSSSPSLYGFHTFVSFVETFVSFTLLLLKHFMSSLDDVSEPLFSKPAGLEEFLAAGCRPGNIHHTYIFSGDSQIPLLFSKCFVVAFHLL